VPDAGGRPPVVTTVAVVPAAVDAFLGGSRPDVGVAAAARPAASPAAVAAAAAAATRAAAAAAEAVLLARLRLAGTATGGGTNGADAPVAAARVGPLSLRARFNPANASAPARSAVPGGGGGGGGGGVCIGRGGGGGGGGTPLPPTREAGGTLPGMPWETPPSVGARHQATADHRAHARRRDAVGHTECGVLSNPRSRAALHPPPATGLAPLNAPVGPIARETIVAGRHKRTAMRHGCKPQRVGQARKNGGQRHARRRTAPHSPPPRSASGVDPTQHPPDARHAAHQWPLARETPGLGHEPPLPTAPRRHHR